MTSIDRNPLTRREAEIVYACTMGVLAQCNRSATPWALTLQAKLRAMYMLADPVDDDPCPPLHDAVPYPCPALDRRAQSRR